jgi:phospholipase A1 protein A
MTDWGALAKASCYPQAVGNLKPVAKCAGQVFNYLKDNAGVNPSTITCVGHSLGAHICGIIANHLTEKLDKIIGKYSMYSL